MQGFGPSTYGDGFADVYDQWYGSITDAEATADFVAARCGTGPLLELGVGSGRLVPALRRAGCTVIGIDASHEMLRRCQTDLGRVRADLGHLPFGRPASVGGAICAFNTLFNLPTADAQGDLLARIGVVLAADGHLVIEAITGAALPGAPSQSVGVSRMSADDLVLSATVVDAATQTIQGQHVEITATGIKLRPWLLRWTTPEQLDAIAVDAGLLLVERYGDWDGRPFSEDSDKHVSVYRPV